MGCAKDFSPVHREINRVRSPRSAPGNNMAAEVPSEDAEEYCCRGMHTTVCRIRREDGPVA